MRIRSVGAIVALLVVTAVFATLGARLLAGPSTARPTGKDVPSHSTLKLKFDPALQIRRLSPSGGQFKTVTGWSNAGGVTLTQSTKSP
jgi:hypothetical protein